MRHDLNLWSYKIQDQQQIKEVDVTRRFEFTNLMLEKIDLGIININNIWFSDEAHFHLNGYVNKQNWRHWGTENPHLAIATPAHPKRITVWCGMTSEVIIGPIFIDGNVTGEKYLELLERDFYPKIRHRRLVQGYWYQQDGARPHRTQDVLESLNTTFRGHLIALDCGKVSIMVLSGLLIHRTLIRAIFICGVISKTECIGHHQGLLMTSKKPSPMKLRRSKVKCSNV